MKRRQVIAFILSAIMIVSSCVPMTGISASAAESTGAGSTEAAAVVEPESEEQIEEQVEESEEVAADAQVELVEEPAKEEPQKNNEEEIKEYTEVETEEPATENVVRSAEIEIEETTIDEDTVEKQSIESAEKKNIESIEIVDEQTAEIIDKDQDSQTAKKTNKAEQSENSDNELYAYAIDEWGDKTDDVYIYFDAEEDIILTVYVSAKDQENITYQWYYKTCDDKSKEKGSLIEGITDSEYTCYSTDISSYKSGTYTCVVTDKFGTSKNVVFDVTINNNLKAFATGKDEDEHWLNYTVPHGEKKTLCVEYSAIDLGNITCQWYDGNGSPIDGMTANTFVSDPIIDKQSYTCTVKDRYGNTVDVHFSLHVKNEWTAYPEGAKDGWDYKDVPVVPGDPVTLTVIVKAENEKADIENLTYNWSMCKDDGPNKKLDIDGCEYTIDSVTAEDRALYHCEVMDQYGNDITVTFGVWPETGLSIVPSSDPKGKVSEYSKNVYDVYVMKGGTVTLKSSASIKYGSSNITYEWRDDNDEILGTGTQLTINNVNKGMYCWCRVSDDYGGYEEIEYRIHIQNNLKVYPEGCEEGSTANIYAEPEEKVKLHTVVEATDKEDLRYTWTSSDGDYLDNNEDTIIIDAYDVDYECEVTDKYGNNATAYFRVIIEEGTEIDENSITLATSSYTYDGIEKTPDVTVEYDEEILVNDEDYTVEYSNNINAGTASAVITGIGNYTGSVTKYFTINKADQSITAMLSDAKISTGGTSKVTVSGVKEAAKLTYSSSNTAVATVSAAGVVKAKKAGKATITVTAAATANYNAASAQTTVSVLPGATTKFTAVAATNGKGIKLTWNRVAGATQYKIYCNNKLIKTVGNVGAYTDTNANKNGTKYTFKIVAKASTGASTKSKSVVYYKVNRPAVKKLTNSASKKMTVKWAKNTKATGYQIQYGLKKNFSGARTVKVNKKTAVSKTIAKLKKGKTYYVRIRTYKKVGKVTYYSAWSAAKKVKIKK